MLEASVQENIAILNVDAPQQSLKTHEAKKLRMLQGKIDKSVIRVAEFNTLWAIDRTTTQIQQK